MKYLIFVLLAALNTACGVQQNGSGGPTLPQDLTPCANSAMVGNWTMMNGDTASLKNDCTYKKVTAGCLEVGTFIDGETTVTPAPAPRAQFIITTDYCNAALNGTGYIDDYTISSGYLDLTLDTVNGL